MVVSPLTHDARHLTAAYFTPRLPDTLRGVSFAISMYVAAWRVAETSVEFVGVWMDSSEVAAIPFAASLPASTLHAVLLPSSRDYSESTILV